MICQNMFSTLENLEKMKMQNHEVKAKHLPDMKKLLLEVEQGLWDAVLVTEIERLARGDTIGDLQENGSYLKYGATLISRKLNQLGIPSRVKGIWTKSSIIDILKNHVYIGMIRYGYRKEVKSVENGELVIKRPYSKDYDLYKGLHTAIIDEITFNNAQNILSNKTHLPIANSKTLKNPLTGLATCMKCNTLMTRLAPSGKTPYACLKCPNNKCNNISSPLELIERVLINELKYWLKDYKIIYNYEITDSPYKKKIKESPNPKGERDNPCFKIKIYPKLINF